MKTNIQAQLREMVGNHTELYPNIPPIILIGVSIQKLSVELGFDLSSVDTDNGEMWVDLKEQETEG